MLAFGVFAILSCLVAVPKHVRVKIIRAHERTNSIAAAAKSVGVSYNTAKRWVERSNTELGLDEIRKGGRPRILTEESELKAMEGLINPKLDGAAHVALELFHSQVTPRKVSKQTVIRAGYRAAKRTDTKLRVVRGRPMKKLSDDVKKKRLEFAQLHVNTDWGHFVYTDRKRFQFRYPGEKVKPVFWSKDGQRQQVAVASHPCSVNVYHGLTRFGTTDPHIVAGTSKHKNIYMNKQGKPSKNIIAAEYQDVLKKTLLPSSHAVFSNHGIQFWVFQQDNDPTHRNAGNIIQEWCQSSNSRPSLLQDWPPHSPDLNPIENMWAWAQAHVNKMGCKTFLQFKAAVIQTLKEVPKEMCANLVDSMRERMKKVVELGGDRLKY